MTLAFEDANSKLVDAVTAADDDCVGNNLLLIWKPRFGQKSKICSDFEQKVWSRFCSSSFMERLMFG